MAGVNILADKLVPETVQSSEAPALSSQAVTEQPTTAAAVPVSTGNDVSAIVDKAMPSVVAINNKMVYTQEDWFFGKQSYEVPSSGSGITLVSVKKPVNRPFHSQPFVSCRLDCLVHVRMIPRRQNQQWITAGTM